MLLGMTYCIGKIIVKRVQASRSRDAIPTPVTAMAIDIINPDYDEPDYD